MDRSSVVSMMQAGGVLVAPAAEQALLGTDDDVRAFLARVQTLQGVDDRIAVNRILSGGGPTVRTRAQQALDSGKLEEFLTTGWQSASHMDQRVRVNQMMAAGGDQLKAAAQRALDADAAAGPTFDEMDQTPSGPLDTFVASGWQKPFELDQRLKVNQILNQAPEGSNVRRLAQRALDTRNVDALTTFLDTQHAVAAARDDEVTTVTNLVLAAERAGVQAAELTETAKEEGAKATAAAEAARLSGIEAQEAMERARGNAKEAAAAAKRAADAATKAARAAAQAMAAAHAAVAAARAAAAAAARAAATAALTHDAANRANKAAADAAVNKDKSDAAKFLAANALKCAKLSKDAAYAVGRAEEVAKNVISIADSAGAASLNARTAVLATQEALAMARATGVNVAEAEAAARRAQNQAARANRAASASLTFARASVKAAGQARLAANRAAEDAIAAANAANEAAAHAGDATKAAQASTNAATAASRAANDAVAAANSAYEVYEAARAVDAERLRVATEEGAEAARAELAAYQQYQQRANWDAQEAAKRDAETNRLIAEVRNPATARATAVAGARQVALTLSRTGGPSTHREALIALGSGDDDVVDFVRTRIDVVAAGDDRATVATMAQTGPVGRRAAALAALDGTDAQVAQFLRDQSYPEQAVDDRIAVNRILNQAKQNDDAATIEEAQRALDGDNQARRRFLTTGQFQSSYHDDRVKANRMLSNPDSGPEVKAAAQNALDGAPGTLHEFVTTGWYAAQQNDYDAAVHELEMRALLARGSAAATTALKNAEEAQAVAANARGRADLAREWADKAIVTAGRAVGYANDAADSANKAEQSAAKAMESARTAAEAAKVANAAAQDAAQSVAVAHDAYARAQIDAGRAIDAAERAKASALAAGKNYFEALGIRNEAYKHANKLIEVENQKARRAQFMQFQSCMLKAYPDENLQRNCMKVYEPTDIRLGKATLNKEFCNKFAQVDTTYYQNCVADTFNPNFMTNRAMDILTAGAIVFGQWMTFAMAGIGLTALTAVCAALCATVLGVLGGAEASMGIGGLFMTWAESSVLGYLAGGAWSSVVGGRLMGALKGSLNKVRIPAVFERVGVPQKTLDANFARLMSLRTPLPCTRKNSFVTGTQVLMADGSTKSIETVRVGDQVLATDPETGVTDARSVTDLISGSGYKELVDITVDADGPAGDATATLTATAEHPFWVPDEKVWRDAIELRSGQWLRTSAGTWAQVTALQARTQRAAVHNLTVDARHTYYVVAGGTSLLVHNDSCGVELEDLGAGWFESPAHLLYGPDSKHGHKILHVLDHGHPNPSKPLHSVFDTGSQGILEIVDEAWLLRGTGLTKTVGLKTYYVIPMGRQVGTRGEKNILIIVWNGDEMITAYPLMPYALPQ